VRSSLVACAYLHENTLTRYYLEPSKQATTWKLTLCLVKHVPRLASQISSHACYSIHMSYGHSNLAFHTMPTLERTKMYTDHNITQNSSWTLTKRNHVMSNHFTFQNYGLIAEFWVHSIKCCL
jgi:hypothetical protein